jgi:hypothetical protein
MNTSDTSKALKQIKYLCLILFISLLTLGFITFNLLFNYQLTLISTIGGSLLGGLLGMWAVSKSFASTKPNLKGHKLEEYLIFRKYQGKLIAFFSVVIYLLILVGMILNVSDYSNIFDLIDFLGFGFLSLLSSGVLYLEVGYLTAWLNFKKNI